MWSSFSRTVFPNLRNMVVQQRESRAGGLVISFGNSIKQLHTDRQARRLAKMLWMLVPRFGLALVNHKQAVGKVPTILAIPPRPTSANFAQGDLAGIEARHISLEACSFRLARPPAT